MRQKLYYIANARMPNERAHGIQLAKMCEAFATEGIQLELITPSRRTVSTSPQKFYGLGHAFAVRRLPVIDVYTWGYFGFIVGSLSFMVSYFFYLLFKKISGKAGIIYTVDLDRFSFALIPLLGMPYFSEMHDRKPKDMVHSFFFRNTRGIIAINRLVKDELLRTFSLKDDDVIVRPNGIDIEFIRSSLSQDAARKKLSISTSKKIVLYAGGCYDWKGLGVLISVANEVKDAMVIYFVGGTSKELKQITGVADIPENLRCFGQRPYPEIPLWLAAADAVVVLGTKRYEYSYRYTSPMKLFEYMAAEKPIVASRTPAIIQIVTEGEVTLYEPDDVKDFSRALRSAVGHSSQIQKKIARSSRKAKEYSWEKRAQSILQFMKLQLEV